MNLTMVLGTWRTMIGVDERLKSIAPDRLASAQRFFGELSAMTDEDQLRARLAHGPEGQEESSRDDSRTDVDDLSLWILSQALDRASLDETRKDGLNWVPWLLFVCQFGKDHTLFEAHGKALQGLLYMDTNQPAEARQALEEAAENYQNLPSDWRGPESVCTYILACIEGNEGQFSAAKTKLDRAEEIANGTARSTSSWIGSIKSEGNALADQQTLITSLLKASSAAEAWEIAAKVPRVADARTVTILRALALRFGATGQLKDSLTLASVADWLAPGLGQQIRCREELAQVATYMNAYSLAEELYRALLAEDPENVDDRRALGNILAQQGRNEEAAAELNRVLQIAPHNAAALRDLGGICLNQNNFTMARRYLESASRIDPSDPIVATLLKQLGNRGGEPLLAFDPSTKQLQISESLLKLPPEEAAMMITATLLRANPEGAQELLQSIVGEKGPEYARRVAEMAFPSEETRETSHYEKAEALFAKRMLAEALAEYRLAITDDRDDSHSYMGAGDCYYHMGRFNLAAAFFEESIAIEPSPSTLRFLGDAHRKAGRNRKAAAAYQQAVELDPSYAPAREQLRVLKEHMGGIGA